MGDLNNEVLLYMNIILSFNSLQPFSFLQFSTRVLCALVFVQCFEHLNVSVLYKLNNIIDNQHPTNITVNMFADDTKFTTVFSDTLDRVLLQDCLSSFTDWADLWQLQIAEHKCCVLSFGNPVLPSYYMNDVQLTNVTEYRDLGVLVDNQCLFRQHVSTICQKELQMYFFGVSIPTMPMHSLEDTNHSLDLF